MRECVYGLRGVLVSLLLILAPAGTCRAAVDELAQGLCRQLLLAPHDPAVTDQLRSVIGRLEDDSEKARYGAVYTLSLLATGQAVAARLQAHMLQNFPASPYARLVAPPYVALICTVCDGTQSVRVACGRCSGSGTCPSCRGSGESRVRGIDGRVNRCMDCQGSGRCTDCHGSGVVDAVCRQCQEGFEPSSLRAEATYHDLLLHIVEGTGLPEVRRATSVRSALAAGDEVAGPATRTHDPVIQAGVAAGARARIEVAMSGGIMNLQGRIASRRTLDDARVSVLIDGIEQFSPDRRTDRHLYVLAWNSVVLQATPRAVEALSVGDTLRIIGPITIVPDQPGHADFPDGVLPVATLWIEADAANRVLVGTLVMREGIADVGDRLFRLAP